METEKERKRKGEKKEKEERKREGRRGWSAGLGGWPADAVGLGWRHSEGLGPDRGVEVDLAMVVKLKW